MVQHFTRQQRRANLHREPGCDHFKRSVLLIHQGLALRKGDRVRIRRDRALRQLQRWDRGRGRPGPHDRGRAHHRVCAAVLVHAGQQRAGHVGRRGVCCFLLFLR